MSSLSHIRNRLRAVGNIKQIATSMEMVASARFRKARDKALQAQFYIAKMQEILDKISSASTDFTHPLLIGKAVKKIGLVVVTSDRGLCGAYNANVLSAANRFLKEQTPDRILLTLLGKKGVQYFQKKGWPIDQEWPGWSGKIGLDQINELSAHLIKNYLEGKVDSIVLIYTKFYTLMEREVVQEKFLPFGKPKQEKREILNYIFEPPIEELYEQLLPRYCMTKIETMLNEAHASELAARIFSMKAAAKNAEEMIDHLTLERNKVRQTGITREMLETTAPDEVR